MSSAFNALKTVKSRGHLVCQSIRRVSYTAPPAAFPKRPFTPWFVDHESQDTRLTNDVSSLPPRQNQINLIRPLPGNLPEHLVALHSELQKSPYLEPGTIEICPPIPTLPGPPLPAAMPKGRRGRGGTDFGSGIDGPYTSIWRWFVLAQVREGTEHRGSIQSVVRVVRKVLLAVRPPLPLPRNSRRNDTDSWAMIDCGDFAVHVLSRTAREKYFPRDQVRTWET